MDNNQKLALKIFRARGYRYMEKLPENIELFTSAIGDFGNCAVIFREKDKQHFFSISVDEEWYLCIDGKFREDIDQAALFPKDAVKNGVVLKEYPSIRHRALEAIAFVMQGKFPKVD